MPRGTRKARAIDLRRGGWLDASRVMLRGLALAPWSARTKMRASPFLLEVVVSLDDLEAAVTLLPHEELTAFARWFEEFLADAWDRRIEADIQAGRLDEAGRKADADFEAGRCKPL
jgi:hypothetical protein